ncbi:MAG: hypothetical protein ACTMIR_13380 [Cellulomonadaceae bacterium]
MAHDPTAQYSTRTRRTLRSDAQRVYDFLEPVFAFGAFVISAAFLLVVIAA